MKFDNMVLYVKPGCPFCHRVLDFMAANGIQIETVDSTDPQHRHRMSILGRPSLSFEEASAYV